MKRITWLLVLTSLFTIPFIIHKCREKAGLSLSDDPRYDLDEYLAEQGL